MVTPARIAQARELVENGLTVRASALTGGAGRQGIDRLFHQVGGLAIAGG